MMLRPSYSINLDNNTFSSDSLGPLVALEVRRCKNGGADEAILSLGRVPALDPAEGGDVTIELGWDGDTELVFTGVVEAVDRGIGRMEVLCLGQQMKPMRARGDRAFVNQSAGQVVEALASEVGVETETIEDGIDLPVYLVDSSRAFYDHCLGLARRCGFDLYTTEEGKLVFSQFAVTSADDTFRYGEQIVNASVEKGVPLEGVTMVPESPASSSGDETASWLIKDSSPHKGEVGGGAATLLVSDPLLRAKEAADTAANARLYLSRRDAVVGHVELMGSPEIRLGEALALEGVPDAGVDGLYQVMAVRHCLDRRRGFRTYVTLGGMP